MEAEVEDSNTKYRTWFRVFAAADICISPIGVMVLSFYLYQGQAYMKLWKEQVTNDTSDWFIDKTFQYRGIIRYTGNLETSQSRAAQLYGIYTDINSRCGHATQEKASASIKYVAIPFIVNAAAHVVNFIVGLTIQVSTRNKSDVPLGLLRAILVSLFVILLAESIACHLLYGVSDGRICPVMSLARLAYFQAVVFIILFRVSHIISAYKYMQAISLAIYEDKRRARLEAQQAKAEREAVGAIRKIYDTKYHSGKGKSDVKKTSRKSRSKSIPNNDQMHSKPAATSRKTSTHGSDESSATSTESVFEGTSAVLKTTGRESQVAATTTIANKSKRPESDNPESSGSALSGNPLVTKKNTVNMLRFEKRKLESSTSRDVSSSDEHATTSAWGTTTTVAASKSSTGAKGNDVISPPRVRTSIVPEITVSTPPHDSDDSNLKPRPTNKLTSTADESSFNNAYPKVIPATKEAAIPSSSKAQEQIVSNPAPIQRSNEDQQRQQSVPTQRTNNEGQQSVPTQRSNDGQQPKQPRASIPPAMNDPRSSIPTKNVKNYKPGDFNASTMSVFARSSEIAPGHAAAHFKIIRPATRRNVEKVGEYTSNNSKDPAQSNVRSPVAVTPMTATTTDNEREITTAETEKNLN